MSKCIKIESWTVKQLLHKINNREINKPKYQRKKKWDVMPKNDTTNKPNEKNFIEFLYETLHSVHPITFGKNKDSAYTNIDGNFVYMRAKVVDFNGGVVNFVKLSY